MPGNTHAVGTLWMPGDGALWASIGEGNIHDGQFWLELYGYVGTNRALAMDPNFLGGKIIRINPDTGAGLDDNPFCGGGALYSARCKVWAVGLRNPFRCDGTKTTVWCGDVGWYTWWVKWATARLRDVDRLLCCSLSRAFELKGIVQANRTGRERGLAVLGRQPSPSRCQPQHRNLPTDLQRRQPLQCARQAERFAPMEPQRRIVGHRRRHPASVLLPDGWETACGGLHHGKSLGSRRWIYSDVFRRRRRSYPFLEYVTCSGLRSNVI